MHPTPPIAFNVPLPISRRHHVPPQRSTLISPQAATPIRYRVCCSSTPSAQASRSPKSFPRESTLPSLEPPSNSPAAQALRDALAHIFRGEELADVALRDTIAPSCTWNSPLVSANGRDEVAKYLADFSGFVLGPVIMITGEEDESDGRVRLEWLLSFTQPLPWRPRVTVSGRSFLSLDEKRAHVVEIVEEWDASTWSVARQILPRLADIVWLYAAPHAELDFGTRKLLKKENGYSIVRVAARPEMCVDCLLSENEFAVVTAVPAIPSYAFVGGLRRLENYSTVSPISVRQTGELRCEFSIPIPGTIFGSSKEAPIPPHPSADVRVALSPARTCAVVRYRGFAAEKLFESTLERLVDKLRRDGYLPSGQAVDRSCVWARSYDSKVGFNGSSEVAIATCGATEGIPPRWNELLIELPGDGA